MLCQEMSALQMHRHQFHRQHDLRVCRNRLEHMHKVFRGLAARGRCLPGWSYGFKLHLICNDKGRILNFMITSGDTDDREPLKMKSFVEFIYGKLFLDGIRLIAKLKIQYERRIAFNVRPDTLVKESHNRNRQWRVDEHGADWAFLSPIIRQFHRKPYRRNCCLLLLSEETDDWP